MNGPRRTWRQRLGIAALCGLTLVLLFAAGAVAYVASLLARIDRVEVALDPAVEPAEAPAEVDAATILRGGEAADAGLEPLDPAGPPQNFLIVGSDDVTGVDADEAILSERDEELAQSLADTIMVLRVVPSDGSATLLSVPRDLWVEIVDDDGNFDGKINGAFNLEDPDERAERLTATVRENLDIPVNHYVHVNWDGFRDLVDIIGGVDVCFEHPRRDQETGFLVEVPGVERLDGDEALAYVRSRRLQEQGDDGVWRVVGAQSDLDRITRQQDFLRLVIDQTDDLRGIGNVRQLQRLVDAALSNVEIDAALAIGEVLDLVRRYGAFGGDDLRTLSLEVVDVDRDGLATLDLVDSEANRRTLDVFRGIEPDAVVPSRITVVVEGPDAAEVAAELREVGFRASSRSAPAAAEPELVYGPGGDDAALVVAAWLGGPVRYVGEVEAGASVVLRLADEPLPVNDDVIAPSSVPPPVEVPTTVPAPTTTTEAPPAPTTTVPAVCS